MTTNEQIAKVVGLRPAKNPFKFKFGLEDDSRYFSDDDFSTSMPLAKLLQQRMVDDGWHFELAHWIESFPDFPPRTYLSATACNFGGRKPDLIFAEADTEPAAIVALFVKVYGIEEEA